MAANEPSKPTTAAPNNTTGSAEVSSVVPDSRQDIPPTTSLAQSGNAATIGASLPLTAAPRPVADQERPPAVTINGAESKEVREQEETEATSLIQALWTDAKTHTHKEVWGVVLADPATHVPSQIVLQKYLNANDGDLTKAKAQLKNTLDWRAKMDPTKLIEKKYASDKFAGLGYITSYVGDRNASNNKAVFTWNIYGGVKDIQKSFGDLHAFIEWRVALMEMAMRELDLNSATEPITANEDRYKIYQVHDYKGISFFRSPPAVRNAAKKTVEVLSMAYPETLKEKFFINVPAIMGFMYGVMKLFVAPKTIKKFHPMSNGALLVHEFADSNVSGLGEKLPKEYGGNGNELTTTGKEPLLE